MQKILHYIVFGNEPNFCLDPLSLPLPLPILQFRASAKMFVSLLGSFVFCTSHHLGDHHYPRLHGLFRSGWPGAFGLSLLYGEPLVQKISLYHAPWGSFLAVLSFPGHCQEAFHKASALYTCRHLSLQLSSLRFFSLTWSWFFGKLNLGKELHVGSFCFLVCSTE